MLSAGYKDNSKYLKLNINADLFIKYFQISIFGGVKKGKNVMFKAFQKAFKTV